MKKDALYEMISVEEDGFLRAKTLYMFIKKAVYGELALKMIKESIPSEIILQTLLDDEDDEDDGAVDGFEPKEYTFLLKSANGVDEENEKRD